MIHYIDQKLILLIYVKFKDLCLHLEQIFFLLAVGNQFLNLLRFIKINKKGTSFCIIFEDPECYDYVKSTEKINKSQSTKQSIDVSSDSYTTRYVSISSHENVSVHVKTNLR